MYYLKLSSATSIDFFFFVRTRNFSVLNFSSFKNMNLLLIYYIVLRDMLQKLCSIFINKFIFNGEVFYLAPSLIRKKKVLPC